MIPPLSDVLFERSINGFLGATVSTAAGAVVASMETEIPKWLLEGGSGVALVCCLVYAVSNLWKANQALQKEIRQTLEAQNKALAQELADAQASRKRLEAAVRRRFAEADGDE